MSFSVQHLLLSGAALPGAAGFGVGVDDLFLTSFQLSGPSVGQAWVAEGPDEGPKCLPS